jgi:PPP family 3-phenylpropionic acid transporter
MSMGIPLFLIFGTYGVVNTYLPILLHDLGYGPTMIGVLQGLFEGAGLLFPVFISSKVDRKGNYGLVLILLAVMMVLVLPPLVAFPSFWVTAAALMVFAVGFKGTVPVVDAFVSRSLGPKATNYGKVRELGPWFRLHHAAVQFTRLIDPASPKSIALWWAYRPRFSPSPFFYPGSSSVSAAIGARGERHPRRRGRASIIPAPWCSGIASLSRPWLLASFWIGISLFFLGFLGMTPSQRFFSLSFRSTSACAPTPAWALTAAAEVPSCSSRSGLSAASHRAHHPRLFGRDRARNLVYAAFPSFGGAVAANSSTRCASPFPSRAVVFVTERVSSGSPRSA